MRHPVYIAIKTGRTNLLVKPVPIFYSLLADGNSFLYQLSQNNTSKLSQQEVACLTQIAVSLYVDSRSILHELCVNQGNTS